jgi:PncC family amidohydrolase
MSRLFRYLWSSKTIDPIEEDFSVAVAESVTAGALANTLCSEPGASKFFKGGIVAYSIASKKEILGVNIAYAEQNNFANPFTTSEMARSVVKIFNARIGISTTGYSLPLYRPENKEKGECELKIDNPYAYICLYDSLTNIEIVKKIEFIYDKTISNRLQRATVQTKVSLECKRIYQEFKKNHELIVLDELVHDSDELVHDSDEYDKNKQYH